MPDKKLSATVTTTSGLLDQFIHSLNSVPTDGTAPPPDSPSPLPLLSTCATSLRAQTTKLSLLIITPPYTPSAISTILGSLNEAILPSLLTATLLLTPSSFTKAYCAEAISLTKATLRDLGDLVQVVATRSEERLPKAEPTAAQQDRDVTAMTGKIWADCDELKQLADGGIAGLVVKKAEQHLELIKDAVKEIEDWDPEDDADDEIDDDDEEGSSNEDDAAKPRPGDEDKDDDDADANANADQDPGPTQGNKPAQDIREIKTSTLKILIRVPQSLHVVIQQRLKKGLPFLFSPSPDRSTAAAAAEGTATITPRNQAAIITILDGVLTNLAQTSTCIDDVAERLYTHDALGALLTAEKARSCVIEIVQAVSAGWDCLAPRAEGGGDLEAGPGSGSGLGLGSGSGARPETKEDRYIKRALDWITNLSYP